MKKILRSGKQAEGRKRVLKTHMHREKLTVEAEWQLRSSLAAAARTATEYDVSDKNLQNTSS
jgi:hypothetical protein